MLWERKWFCFSFPSSRYSIPIQISDSKKKMLLQNLKTNSRWDESYAKTVYCLTWLMDGTDELNESMCCFVQHSSGITTGSAQEKKQWQGMDGGDWWWNGNENQLNLNSKEKQLRCGATPPQPTYWPYVYNFNKNTNNNNKNTRNNLIVLLSLSLWNRTGLGYHLTLLHLEAMYWKSRLNHTTIQSTIAINIIINFEGGVSKRFEFEHFVIMLALNWIGV